MNTRDALAAIGLAVGGAFGMAGTFVSQPSLRQALWGIDGIALIVATALLTIKFARQGRDVVAAGFLVFAIGEGLIVSGAAMTLEASIPSFGAGVGLWAAALLLTSVPREFALWVRAAGTLAATLFAVVAARIFWGEAILPTTAPLPFFAFPFLVLTFAGWIWTLVTEKAASSSNV